MKTGNEQSSSIKHQTWGQNFAMFLVLPTPLEVQSAVLVPVSSLTPQHVNGVIYKKLIEVQSK
jgi:hypothetical protein